MSTSTSTTSKAQAQAAKAALLAEQAALPTVSTFVAQQAALLVAIDRDEQAAVAVLAALQSLAVAASLALKDGASLPVLQSANVAALTAQGWNIERTGDQDGASRRARGLADAMFVSKAALAYLAFTGDLYGLPVADDGNVPDSKAVLSLMRRAYKGSKADGLGVSAVRQALKADTQQGAVAYLKAALTDARAVAGEREQAEQDAANEQAQASAPATVADIIRGAASLVTDGAPVTPDVLAALAELRGAVSKAQAASKAEQAAPSLAIAN